MFCIKCGKELSPNTAFCPFCGTLQTDQALNVQMQVDHSKKPVIRKRKTVLICCLAVIIVLTTVLLWPFEKLTYDSAEEVTETLFVSFMERDFDKAVTCLGDWVIRDMAGGSDISMEKAAELLEQYYYYHLEDIFRSKIAAVTLVEYVDVEEFYWQGRGLTKEEYNSVDKVAHVLVTIYEDGKGADDDGVICVEIDGQWYIANSIF